YVWAVFDRLAGRDDFFSSGTATGTATQETMHRNEGCLEDAWKEKRRAGHGDESLRCSDGDRNECLHTPQHRGLFSGVLYGLYIMVGAVSSRKSPKSWRNQAISPFGLFSCPQRPSSRTVSHDREDGLAHLV